MSITNKRKAFNISPIVVIILIIALLFGDIEKTVIVIIMFSLHELAHYITAKKMNLNTSKFSVHPVGATMTIDGLIDNPSAELIISSAGPVVNLIFAGIFGLISIYIKNNSIINYAITINLSIGIFNLLPGLPLDGGRILRSILSKWLGFNRATRITVIIGKCIAVCFVLLGIICFIMQIYNPLPIIVGIIIYFAAHKETKLDSFAVTRNIIGKKIKFEKNGQIPIKWLQISETLPIAGALKLLNDSYITKFVVVNQYMEENMIVSESQLINMLEYYSVSTQIINIKNGLHQ